MVAPMKRNFPLLHGFTRPSSASAALLREARRRRKIAVESKHIASPTIWLDGEECVPAGPLPIFLDALTFEEALRQMPQGARLATVKCVAAWRDGHLDTRLLLDFLRSIAWQAPALKHITSLALHAGRQLSRETSEESGGEEQELLSDEDIAIVLSK